MIILEKFNNEEEYLQVAREEAFKRELWDGMRWKIDEIIDNYDEAPFIEIVLNELREYYTFDELFICQDSIMALYLDYIC